MLDLTQNYHNALAALWFHSGARLDSLSDFVDSPIYLDGIAFDARGYVLAMDQSPKSAKSKDILVRRLCRRVHLLQTAWATWPSGTRLGSYRVYFADGDRREIPIVYGRDVGVFVTPPPVTEIAATVAWEHQFTDGARLRSYRLTWDNPRPDTAIDHLEFIAERKTGEPALLAVTVEP